MGKTTTLFQIAEAVLENGHGSPIVVPLGDWSADNEPLLEAVLKRPAFREISEDDLRAVAMTPGVILLLDGWNELDSAVRQRAKVQVERLQLEMPGLSLLVATRKQALDVPIDGTRVILQPLNETQQLEIARALRGCVGERVVEQAWRTAGVRELVTIPLYLTSLLALPEGAPFPTTKEEVLRRFVAVHEENKQGVEVLAQVTQGLHQRYLEGLAVTATRLANTTMAEAVARKSVFETGVALVTEGQIAERPQPAAVLTALVSHHVLVRVDDTAGYSFQHQQFQEWYASHLVEHVMLKSVDDDTSREALKVDILDQRVWEEAILFACERLARGNKKDQESCGEGILAALDVDPLLAAEMIYRSTDGVWARVGPRIKHLVERWHEPGNVDRGLRFMITAGRKEFFDLVWPLITHDDDQVHLRALRACGRFRPSLLGDDAPRRLGELPLRLRRNVLHEIAHNSGTDGLDLAATVAKADPASEVKASVAEALAFRRADRHLAELLHDADEETFDWLCKNNLIADIADESAKARLTAARKRLRLQGLQTFDHVHSLVYGSGGEDEGVELTTVIAEMDIDDKRTGAVNLIYEAKNRFSHAVAQGILHRVREGRTLPYGAAELMAEPGFTFEDETLLNIALGTDRFDDRAKAAVSVLGPQAVGRLIDSMFELKGLVRDSQGKYDQVVADRSRAIQRRIRFAQPMNLVGAIEARSAQADDQRMADLAELISDHPDGKNGHGQPFDANARTRIAGFVEDWGNRLLNSPDSTRAELAAIATLACCAPAATLVPVLRRLLDEEIGRWRAFNEQARAARYRRGRATNQMSVSWALRYQQAFLAIHCPETAALMRDYLCDEYFGCSAAVVLAGHWRAVNEPSDETRWDGVPDFSPVAEKRALRTSHPDASSPEGDAIFCAVERLIGAAATDVEERHAVSLAIVAAALPHGKRDDTINMIIRMANRRQRSALLNNLVLSGKIIDVELVKQGIADMLAAAPRQPWVLTEGDELRYWLWLLPFVNRPSEAFDIVKGLPEEHRTPHVLEQMLKAFEFAPNDEAEAVLFQLAETDSRLYAYHGWRDAVFRLGTPSSAKQLVGLAAQGVFNRPTDTGGWELRTRLASLIGEYSVVRAHVYGLLTDLPLSAGTVLLAQAVAENPDEAGLLLLIELEIAHKRAFASYRTIESVVTKHVPDEDWKGAYNVIPVPAVELRRKLLSMTTGGGPTDTAACYLIEFDMIRDNYGTPESEPRHPDLPSGKAWPILGRKS